MLAAHIKVIKFALNVWIVRSAALCLCRCGCTNWYLVLLLSKPCLSVDYASLSRMWVFGLFPLVVNVDSIEILVSMIYAELLVLVGIVWILLLS